MSNEEQLPHFLGIGAQRSSSTWLYENLKKHPEIWVPPLKEIHFFDTLGEKRIETKAYRRHFKRRVWAYFLSIIKPRSNQYTNLGWDYDYFFKKRGVEWYRAVFRPEIGQIAGEITPAYATLDKNIVQDIYILNPKLKVIFFMRDPIERVWSGAIKGLARDKKKSAKTIPQAAFMEKITSTGAMLRGDYLRTLEIWESVFPSEQIHIDFMDEVRESPQNVLLRVFRFLGISDDGKYIPAGARQKKNSTDGYKIPIPPEIELYLAKIYLPELRILSKRFGGHTLKWLEHAQSILDRQP